MTVWHVPENEAAGTPYAITVTTPGAASGPRSTVVTGWPAGWTDFPKIVSASRSGVLLGNLEVTAQAGGTLTISGPIDGYADFALAVGDTLDLRPSKLAVTEIHDALQIADTDEAAFPGYHIACWGDSFTVGYPGTSGYPEALAALVPRDVYNGGQSGDSSTSIRTRMLAATNRYSNSAVIWAGRNNYAALSTVTADIAAMVAALGHDRYLVLSVMNGAGEGTGTTAYTDIMALNAALAAAYPDHWYDVRADIVAHYDSGISQDVTDHSADIPPTSLRADTLHLNPAGYNLVADGVAARLDVLNGPSRLIDTIGLAPTIKAAVHTDKPNTFTASQVIRDDAATDLTMTVQSLGNPSIAVSTVSGVVSKIQSFSTGFVLVGAQSTHDLRLISGGQELLIVSSSSGVSVYRSFTLAVLADAAAQGYSLYLSSDRGYNACYKDGGGTVRPWLNDVDVVHMAGNETVAGVKTFSSAVTLTTGKINTGVASGGGNVGFELAAPSYSSAGEVLLSLTEGGNSRFKILIPNPFGVPSVELRAGNSGNWFRFYPNDAGTDGVGRLDFNGATTYFQAAASYFNGDIELVSGHNFYFDDGNAFVFGSTSGNRIGTLATQKISFWGVTPVVQPTGNIMTGLAASGVMASPTLSATDITSTAVSPASLSANTNDYAPAAGRFYRLTASTPVNITGMVAAADGVERHMWNIGSNTITLVHQSASSVAANRWLTTTGANLALAANKCAVAVYDATTAAWRVSLLP